MNKKLYASLLIGVSLAVINAPAEAKSAPASTKKHSATPSKTSKKTAPDHHKPEKTAKSATTSKTTKPTKQTAVASSKHNKSTKTIALAESKNKKSASKVASAKKTIPESKHSKLTAHLKQDKHKSSNKHSYKVASTRRSLLPSEPVHSHEDNSLELSLATEQPEYSPVKIPFIASENPLVSLNQDSTDNNPRIHSLIPANNTAEEINRRTPLTNNNPENQLLHYTSTHGIITSSLATAGAAVGLSDELITQLTRIFAWDIDFATNLHLGDQFTVVYELTATGDEQIVAAEFVNEGRILTAVRYEDSEGNVNYYTPEGKAMRKAFLSTPVDYARISSHYDPNRRHPILNRIRAHKGVDYAARIGTPVKAAGSGKIAFLGRKGGYGQVIILKHGEHYETLYAHLSDFKRGLLEGDTVEQGDIIGYVGQTGLATGPHLHYEFRVDGIHHNPEHQEPRHLMALNGGLLADFKASAQPVLAQLYATKAQTLFAKNQQNPVNTD